MKTDDKTKALFDKVRSELIKYNINTEGIFENSYSTLRDLYALAQKTRTNPNIRIQALALKVFDDCRKMARNLFLIIAIDDIAVDEKRLKAHIKRHGHFTIL